MRALADWTSASLKGREQEYTYTISEADIAELDRAVQALKPRLASEDDVLKVSLSSFQRCILTLSEPDNWLMHCSAALSFMA